MKRRRALLFTFIVVLALCAACGVWLHRERQRHVLNRQLIYALVYNDITKALALVNEGADPNTRYVPPPAPTLPQLLNQLLYHTPPPTNESPTAFLMACGTPYQQEDRNWGHVDYSGDPALVQTMIAHGANLHLRGPYGTSALGDAVYLRYTRIIKLLLEHGAEANINMSSAKKPLMVAAFRNDSDLINILLAHGAKINAQDAAGFTALQYAVWVPRKTIVRLLLKHGADPNLTDKNGDTALRLATQHKHYDLVRLLKQHGAN